MKSKYNVFFSILSISFWFFIGFPFTNYYESFMWIADLNNSSFINFIFQKTGHYSSYRPLGQVTAVFLYNIFQHSLAGIQLFTFIVTILSLALLTISIKEKKILFIILTIIGGIYFKAFNYLFHLHGLYYSVILLLVLVLIYFYDKPFSFKNILSVFLIVLITSMFHPFVLFLYIFFLVGYTAERDKAIDLKYYFLFTVLIISSIGLLFVLVPNQLTFFRFNGIMDLLKVYQSVEINSILSFLSFLFSQLTVWSINRSLKIRGLLSISLFLVSVIFYLASIPIIIGWILASVIKVFLLKKWALLSIISITFIFPVFTGFESNHMAFLVLVVCVYTLPLNYQSFEYKLNFINTKTQTIYFILVSLLFISLKIGIDLPIISKYVNLLLAEKERTLLLEKIIANYLNSEYRNYEMIFLSEQPSYSKQQIKNLDNLNNPATSKDLNKYLNSLRIPSSFTKAKKHLLISFNDIKLEGYKLVFSINGKYAGKASVFLSD